MRTTLLIFILLFTLNSCGIFAPKTATTQPVEAIPGVEMVRQNGVIYYVHPVKQGETLYSLGKHYGVTIDDMVSDNPKLKEGLKTGSIIYIRQSSNSTVAKKGRDETVKEKNSTTSEERKVVKTEEHQEKREESPIIKFPKIASSNTMYYSRVNDNENNIALILPIGSSGNQNSTQSNFLDFYQGFLLAVQKMKTTGMSLNIDVIDIANYPNTEEIISSGTLDRSDLIIGPVFANQIEPIAKFSSENMVALVSPMDPQSEKFVQGNPFFFQVSTPTATQQESLLNEINNNSDVVIVYEGSESNYTNLQLTKDILSKKGIRYSELPYSISKGKSAGGDLRSLLNRNSENKIIVLSDSEAIVSDILRHLEVLSQREKYNMTIYGTPRWRNFKNVDFNIYHTLNLHISLQHIVNYDTVEAKEFLSKYRAMYKSEPSPYAFQAYDIGVYFLTLLKDLGPEFANDLLDSAKCNSSLIQTDFHFIKNGEGDGYLNQSVREMIYSPDYSVKISSKDKQ